MQIKFYYPKGLFNIEKETIVKKVTETASQYLTLPKLIEIEFQHMGPSFYAETDIVKKRITLNFDLSTNELVIPVSHELLHLEQIETGRLSKSRFGEYVWEGNVYKIDPVKIPYVEYRQLPWELDIVKKQKILLEKVLKN